MILDEHPRELRGAAGVSLRSEVVDSLAAGSSSRRTRRATSSRSSRPPPATDQPKVSQSLDGGRDDGEQQPGGDDALAVDRATDGDGEGTEDAGDDVEVDLDDVGESSITAATTRPTTRCRIVVTASVDITQRCTRARSRASFSGSWTIRRGASRSSR